MYNLKYFLIQNVSNFSAFASFSSEKYKILLETHKLFLSPEQLLTLKDKAFSSKSLQIENKSKIFVLGLILLSLMINTQAPLFQLCDFDNFLLDKIKLDSLLEQIIIKDPHHQRLVQLIKRMLLFDYVKRPSCAQLQSFAKIEFFNFQEQRSKPPIYPEQLPKAQNLKYTPSKTSLPENPDSTPIQIQNASKIKATSFKSIGSDFQASGPLQDVHNSDIANLPKKKKNTIAEQNSIVNKKDSAKNSMKCIETPVLESELDSFLLGEWNRYTPQKKDKTPQRFRNMDCRTPNQKENLIKMLFQQSSFEQEEEDLPQMFFHQSKSYQKQSLSSLGQRSQPNNVRGEQKRLREEEEQENQKEIFHLKKNRDQYQQREIEQARRYINTKDQKQQFQCSQDQKPQNMVKHQTDSKQSTDFNQQAERNHQTDFKESVEHTKQTDQNKQFDYKKKSDYRKQTEYNQQGEFRQQSEYNQQGEFRQQSEYSQQGEFRQQSEYKQQMQQHEYEKQQQKEFQLQKKEYQQLYRDYQQPSQFEQKENQQYQKQCQPHQQSEYKKYDPQRSKDPQLKSSIQIDYHDQSFKLCIQENSQLDLFHSSQKSGQQNQSQDFQYTHKHTPERTTASHKQSIKSPFSSLNQGSRQLVRKDCSSNFNPLEKTCSHSKNGPLICLQKVSCNSQHSINSDKSIDEKNSPEAINQPESNQSLFLSDFNFSNEIQMCAHGSYKRDPLQGSQDPKITQDHEIHADNGILIYKGGIINGKKEGFGIEYNPQPLIYHEKKDLNYRNFQEFGKYWIKYDGQYDNGKKHGFGTLILSNNERFCGNFQENVPQGTGIYYQNGLKLKGIWKAGILLE